MGPMVSLPRPWKECAEKRPRRTIMRCELLRVLPFVFAATLASGFSFRDPPVESGSARTPAQIVLLGTGTPNADPDRSGPSVAIVVNDTPYLVDFGPGVVRRASAAFQKG